MQETFSWKRFAWLGIGTFLFYLWMAWALPITDTVESNYALSAVTMMQHGEFLSPMIYDVYWFDKPIVAYWGLILSYSLFGISDLAARLPSISFPHVLCWQCIGWLSVYIKWNVLPCGVPLP